MKIGWRDVVATLLVAAIVVPYIGYLVHGMPFIQDPRGMAATGLVLGLAAAAVVGREAFRGTWGAVAAFFAVTSGALGAVTFVRAEEGALSEGLLAAFVVAVVVAWALAELVRTRLIGTSAGHSAR
ncbi:hypothetical protein [Pseudonocardia adelaidensis]|uniref:hypothetical protein n=1 Tax=Pseudonocardia adelaidensis TaxID=648754 RepID=UPI0031F0E6F5